MVKGARQIGSALLGDVLASPFQVLVGRHSLAYAQHKGLFKLPLTLLNQALLDQALLSRLPRKNLFSISGLGWQQFKNLSLGVRIGIVLVLASGVTLQLWDAW